jgi:23S rRNA pseudouridine1911/1915/1917 synthase
VTVRFVVAPDEPAERLDKLLTRRLPDTSRATVQRWIEEGRVLVDGRSRRGKDLIRGGAIIDVEPGPRPTSRAEPDASVRFGVLHEDPHLIVVDKPAGVVVHPARGHAGGTLVNGLLARDGFVAASADPRDKTGSLRPGIVHRIDKDTSGVLVVAKDDVTREGLKAQLMARSVERYYFALTQGVPLAGRIDTLYARDPRSRLRFTSRVKLGRRAITHVEVLEALAGARAALVRCRLETGRTHQIRVHLAERAQTPLLADKLYGRTAPEGPLREVAAALGRQALHAAAIGFVHPVTGESLRFESALPEDMTAALTMLRSL